MTTTPSVAEVRAIITTAMTDDQVTALIGDAELMVEHCISSLAASRQKAIIKWVTAHLISMSTGENRQLTQFKLGDAQEAYASMTLGEALKASRYGQQAINLDPNGCIANIGKRKVGMTVL